MVLAPALQGRAALACRADQLVAFIEYYLAVLANRWAATVYSPAQLKTIQEVITASGCQEKPANTISGAQR
jgi:hypothetical protein